MPAAAGRRPGSGPGPGGPRRGEGAPAGRAGRGGAQRGRGRAQGIPRGSAKEPEGEPKIEKAIDEAISEYAKAYRMLAGCAAIGEACRDAEIARLEWQDIDLGKGFIEVKAENAKTAQRLETDPRCAGHEASARWYSSGYR